MLNSNSQLSKAQVELENCRRNLQMARDSEARLQNERDILMRERQSQSVLMTNIESIKTSLERAQAEDHLRVEQRYDDATRECAALRRRLQEEQDRFRELTLHLERQATTAMERLAEQQKIAEQAQSDLEKLRISEAANAQRLEELRLRLRQAETSVIPRLADG